MADIIVVFDQILMLCKWTDLIGREWGAEKRKSNCKEGQNGKEEEEEEDDTKK